MGSSVSVCSQRDIHKKNFVPGTVYPADYINAYTTPENFAAVCSQQPSYKLRHLGRLGYTALHHAAKNGNIPMIEDIARDRIGAKQLLDLGDAEGCTSLFVAIQYNQRYAARVLISLGAEVNMKCLDYRLSSKTLIRTDETYRTPLSLAIEGDTFLYEDVRTQKVAMAKLLLLHGGIVEPKPKTEEGIQILKQAQKEVDEIEFISTLFRKVFESTSTTNSGRITTIISSYVPLDEVPDSVPELPVSLYMYSSYGWWVGARNARQKGYLHETVGISFGGSERTVVQLRQTEGILAHEARAADDAPAQRSPGFRSTQDQ